MSILENKEIYDPSQGSPFDVLKKYFDELDSKILDTSKKMEVLEKSIKGFKSASDGAAAKKLIEETAKLATETENLNKQNKARNDISEKIKTAESKLVNLYDSEAQQLAEVNLELQERRAELKKTAKENKVAKDSLIGLNIELSKLRKKYDTLSKAERGNEKVGGKLLKNIQALDAETKQLSATTGRHQKQVGNYPKIFGLSGKGIKGLIGGFKSLGTELLAAGGIVGGVSLLVDGMKSLYNASVEITKISKQLQGSFNLTESGAKSTAAQIRALAGTFDEDYNQVLKAATAVSKELDISVQEATDRIQEGFLKGSNTGGEFLDILQEYPAQFRAAGIDAETTFAIINQTAKEGLYSDKGIDAIKEGGLRLRENNAAVQASLTPLDESVRAQIKQEVAAGRSFEAIKLVSEALNDTSLTAEETQAIVANVFGGAGEDAGLRYLQSLQDIESTLEDVSIQASESEQSTLKLNEGWNDFVAGVSGNSVLTNYFADVKNTLGGILKDIGDLFDSTEKKAKRLTTLTETQESQRKTAAQKRAEELRAEEAQAKIDEENRKVRFAEWQKRQAERDRVRKAEINDFNKKNELVLKDIDNIDKQIEKEDESLERSIERLEEEDELDIEYKDVALARQEQFEADSLKIKEEYDAKAREILLESLALSGEAIGEAIFDAEKGFKEFSKSLLFVFLDATEKFIQLSLARIVANELGTKSFAGIATAAVLSGLVKASFNAAKSSISNFATGTEYVEGAGTETSDSIPAMLSKGERVVPAKINKMLGNISNDELPYLLNSSNQSDNYNLENLLNENNILNSKIVNILGNGFNSYESNGVVYVFKSDGSGVKKIIQNKNG